MYVKIKLTEKRVDVLFKAGVSSLSHLYKVLEALNLKATIELEEWGPPLNQAVKEEG